MTQIQEFKWHKFINREKEVKYLKDYLKDLPNAILFLSWPKSTGKTTLVNKVIEDLSKEKKWEYAISYLDMRRVLIKNFSDFKNLFFPETLKWKVAEIISGLKFNIWFFWWDADDEALLEVNIFALMIEKLEKANKKWIRPVIILDEFHYLRDIIIDKEHNLTLTSELFKFFIALTKVEHLAHIICLTSDSYYLWEIYSEAKLKNTSDFYHIDHLEKQDILYWLQEEWFSKNEATHAWKYLWWSVHQVYQIIQKKKNGYEWREAISDMIDYELAKLHWLHKTLASELQDQFVRINTAIAQEWAYEEPAKENNFDLLQVCIDQDLWY